MGRMVDVDAIVKAMGVQWVPATVLGVPVVDAQPVVRCKDCEHMDEDGFCYRFMFGKTVPDGYCAWGERREPPCGSP